MSGQHTVFIRVEGEEHGAKRAFEATAQGAREASRGFRELASALFLAFGGGMRGTLAAFVAQGSAAGKVLVALAGTAGALARFGLTAGGVAARGLSVLGSAAKSAAFSVGRLLTLPIRGAASLFSSAFGRVGRTLQRIWTIATGILVADTLRNLAFQIRALAREAFQSLQYFEQMATSMQFFLARELRAEKPTMDMAQALELVRGQAQDVARWLQEIAVLTPFTPEGIETTLRTFMAYGFGVKQAQRLTEIMIDYAAAAGLTSDEMRRVALALGQIRARGRLAGQEVVQLANNAIPVLDIMAKKMGTTVQEVDRLFRQGKIGAEEAVDAIVEYMEKNFSGATSAMRNTWWGLMQSLKGTAALFGQDILAPILEAARPVVQGIRDAFSSLFKSGEAQRIGKALADALGFKSLDPQTVAWRVREALRGVTDILRGNLRGALAHFFKGSQWQRALAVFERLSRVFDNLRTGVRGFVEGIMPGVRALIQAVAPTADLNDTAQSLSERFRELAPLIGEKLGQALLFIAERLPEVEQFISDVIAKAVEFKDQAVTAFEEAKARVEAFIAAAQARFAQFRATIQPVIDFLEMLGRVFSETLAQISFAFGLTGESSDKVREALGRLWESTRVGLGLVGQLLGVLGAFAAAVLSVVLPAVIAAGKTLWDTFVVTVQHIIVILGGLAQYITGLLEAIVALFQGDGERAKEALVKAFRGMSDAVQALMRGIGDIVMGVLNAVLQLIGGFVLGAANLFRELYNKVVGESVSGIARETISILNSLATDALAVVKNAVQSWYQAIASRVGDFASVAGDIVDGIVNGIRRKMAGVSEAIKDMARSALRAMQNILGISSPSKEFAKLGAMAAEGFAVGFEKMGQRIKPRVEAVSRWQLSATAAAVSGAPRGGAVNMPTTIIVNGARDPKAVADEVSRILARRLRLQGGLV